LFRISNFVLRIYAVTDVIIKARLNGPFLVRGPAKLIDHEGREFDLAGAEDFVLCRCGQSAKKPFCDGSHKSCGWVSEPGAASPKPNE
jgi:CDGSH-type Zn-finger protein